MGAIFSRTEDGRIAQRPFGAGGAPRTCYAADITGHVLLHVLYEQLVKSDVTVYEEWFALDLVTDGERCVGVTAWDLVRGGVQGVEASAVIMATGGLGRMYHGTTNAYACTGDGMSMAWRAGVPLKDMEFMQFHPTTLQVERRADHRGLPRRGRLPAQQRGRPLHVQLRPQRHRARLARRRVALGADRDRRGPRRRRLRAARPHPPRRQADQRAAARLARAGHGLRRRRSDRGADPGAAGIALPHGRHRHRRLGAHRSCPGLYAAGECACVSVHGANRLGGNSLLETIVFGRRTGAAAAQDVRRERQRRRVLAVGRARSPSAASAGSSTRTTASARTCCARSWPMPCTTTPASSASAERL